MTNANQSAQPAAAAFFVESDSSRRIKQSVFRRTIDNGNRFLQRFSVETFSLPLYPFAANGKWAGSHY
jgi:hypothetical protein